MGYGSSFHGNLLCTHAIAQALSGFNQGYACAKSIKPALHQRAQLPALIRPQLPRPGPRHPLRLNAFPNNTELTVLPLARQIELSQYMCQAKNLQQRAFQGELHEISTRTSRVIQKCTKGDHQIIQIPGLIMCSAALRIGAVDHVRNVGASEVKNGPPLRIQVNHDIGFARNATDPST